jgi:hypothetical protein
LEQRVTEQSPPSVGSLEWSHGAAQEKRQQQERVKDNEALREAASSPGRSSSSSSNSNSSGSYVRSNSNSGSEVMQGRVESRNTRQRAAAARTTATAAEKPSGASGRPDEGVSAEEVMHQLRPAGTPGRFSDLEKAQAVAARSSSGRKEGEVSKIEEQLGKEDVDAKSHQAALGGGESVHLNLNDSYSQLTYRQ